jgi:putative MATE family efflux protein
MGNKIIIDPSENRLTISKRVSKLALPIIFSNLLYTVESGVSILLVSGISPTAVAGVGYSASMLWFIYSLMALSYTGTSVLTAQRVGAGKDPSPALLWGLILSFLIALPLTFFGPDLTTALMVQFGASKEVAEVSHQYLKPIFLFITVGFTTNTFYAAYNGYGDTKTPFKIGFLMSLINISASYLLIYGKFGLPRLEVAGAGWGVALSEIFGLLAYLYLYVARKKPFPIRLDLRRDILLRMLRIGSPTALERAITSLSFNIFVGMVASFGDKALAAHQVGLRVESVSFMVGFGFMIASTVVAGQNFGAGNYKGLQRGISTIAHLTASYNGSGWSFSAPIPKGVLLLLCEGPAGGRFSGLLFGDRSPISAPDGIRQHILGSTKGHGKDPHTPHDQHLLLLAFQDRPFLCLFKALSLSHRPLGLYERGDHLEGTDLLPCLQKDHFQANFAHYQGTSHILTSLGTSKSTTFDIIHARLPYF